MWLPILVFENADQFLSWIRRGYLREVLRHAGDGSGYECQEDEGAFMSLGFPLVSDGIHICFERP